MRRLAALIVMVAGACGCTPLHPTLPLPPPKPATDYVLRWMCPTFQYDSRGMQIYFYVNTAGYNDLTPQGRATCTPIKPVQM